MEAILMTRRRIVNLKHLFAALAFILLALTANASAQQPVQKVTIKSDLASPVMLENVQEKLPESVPDRVPAQRHQA
jgi:hypothetical protein